MSYHDIVKRYSEVSGITATDAKQVCDNMLSIIMDAAMEGESIDIYGFGKLYSITSEPRISKGFDGETCHVPAKRRLMFKTSKAFAARLAETVQ